MAWLGAVGGLGAAVLYLAAIAAQGGVQDGDGPMAALVAGSFLVTAGACAAAAMTSRRRPAVVLLALALVPPLVWGVLAIFSIGAGFLALAAVVGVALVQTFDIPKKGLTSS
ncbi:MAG TPA: hypothetical protein VK906_13525 [Egicoccus sp.]|nr:hypothetical protein [Egicoccus sp.]HSK24200.1 hypothetical protein [Egicoccus sp.]